MIVDKDGRRRSVRTLAEDDELLASQIDNLSDSELEYLAALLKESDAYSNEGSSLASMGKNVLYRWTPVPIDEFLSDEYYLGLSTNTLYPKIRDDLIELFSMGSVREVILTGSIGYGKTMLGSIAICRVLYELSCLRSPQLSFDMSPGSEMVISAISKSLPLARTVLKTAIEDKIKLSKYFEVNFPFKYGRDISQFPNNIQLGIGSFLSSRTLGQNVFAGVMDEANFGGMKMQQIVSSGSGMKTVANYDLAEKVYASIVRRIKSRFLRSGGHLPGLMILLSSAHSIGSFTDRRIAESVSDPSVFVRDYSAWEVKPASHFSGEKFQVVVGTSSLRSRVLTKEDRERMGDWLEKEDAHIIDVPIEYFDDFDRDLEGSIRDIAGISTHAISVFIHRIEMVAKAVNPDMRHPFTVEEYTYGEAGSFIWELLSKSRVRRLPGDFRETYWVPIRNPTALRYIHIDPSVSGDCTGLAMGHVEKMVEVVRRDEDGNEYNDIAPYIVIDFMLRVRPPPGDQIFLPDIRRLVYELMEHGFHLSGFSCDSYQSTEMLQQMSLRGVKCEVVSVDLNTTAYDALKSATYESRIEYYQYKPYEDEIKKLERDLIRGKIDHPVAGCFVGDTLVGIADGFSRKISDVEGVSVSVHALNENGDVVVCMARGRMTRMESCLLEIRLSDGSCFRCTLEHPWRLLDGTYVIASDLVCGEDRLALVHSVDIGKFENRGAFLTVISKEVSNLSIPVPVYDLSVCGLSNFVLWNGAVVHNSKDVSDAVAGVIHGLTEKVKRMPLLTQPDMTAKEHVEDHSWVNPRGMIPVGEDFDIEEYKDEHGGNDFPGEGFYPIIG